MIREGVLPAVTTPCTPELRVEHGFLVVHLERLLRGEGAGFVKRGPRGGETSSSSSAGASRPGAG